jgi:outer membrane murein-binding lipoprotein Lpp
MGRQARLTFVLVGTLFLLPPVLVSPAAQAADTPKELQAKVEKLAAQVQELEAQLAQLKARAVADRKAEDEATLKYMRAIGVLVMEAVCERDHKTVGRFLSDALIESMRTNQPGSDVERLVQRVNPEGKYRGFFWLDEVLAPAGDEAILRGHLRGKDVQATFTLQIVKDKKQGRYAVNLLQVKAE